MRGRAIVVLWIVLAIVSVGLVTQLLAWVTGYPSEFGTPQYGGLYSPHMLVLWLIRYEIVGRALAITGATLGVLLVLDTVLAIWLYQRVRAPNSDIHGSAQWASDRELRRRGMMKAGGLVLCQSNKAELVERNNEWKVRREGEVVFSNDTRHTMMVAPSGKGKGVNFVIPSLLSWRESVVVYDIKRENWEQTAGWRRQFSYTIRWEPTVYETPRWNPLLEIERGPREVSEVQNLVEVLADPNGTGEEDHFDAAAKELLVGLILHVLYTREEKTLAQVYGMLNDPNRPTAQLFEEMLETEHTNDGVHPVVAQSARSAMEKPERELGSVLSSANTYLSLYRDPIVAHATSACDFRVDDVQNRDRPVSLYVVIQPAEQDRLRPLIRLFFQMLGNRLTRSLDYRYRALLMIDEFASLGKLGFFERQIGYFRGFGVVAAIVLQSLDQLYDAYGERTSIPDNCQIKVVMGADSPTDADRIRQYLGQDTVTQESVSRSVEGEGWLHRSRSYSSSETGRSLLTSDEVLRLPYWRVIVLRSGHYPYRGKKLLHFQDSRFKGRTGFTAPESWEEQRRELAPVQHSWSGLVSVSQADRGSEGEETPAGSESDVSESESVAAGEQESSGAGSLADAPAEADSDSGGAVSGDTGEDSSVDESEEGSDGSEGVDEDIGEEIEL
jgi:type IV secretion system protein VirD4